MQQILLFTGLVVLACILTGRIGDKLPAPTLLLFIGLGMLFGVDGPAHIWFEDFALTSDACNIALLFIMFYGGFNTNLERARPVALQAVLLSTAGVVLTAGAVAVFCRLAFGTGPVQSLLVGSVIASTDAASVFNVLRGQHLALRDGTDSLLEIESGSNDPLSYLLTAVCCALLAGQEVSVPLMLAQQILIGTACGVGVGALAAVAVRHVDMAIEKGETIFLIAVAIIAYALPGVLGGNGFLSVYLAGIVLGSKPIPAKRDMARTFDVITEICQMVIFFLLGLLSTPTRLPAVVAPALAIFAFITFAGRPLACTALLAWSRPGAAKLAVVSWAGLRGAASAVFALQAVNAGLDGAVSLFDTVFVLVMVSLVVQGSLLPTIARILGVVDATTDVMMTFNDFEEESELSITRVRITAGHPWEGVHVRDLPGTDRFTIVSIVRGGEELIPNGGTLLLKGDTCNVASR